MSIWATTLWMYGLAIAVSMGVAVIIKLIVVALSAFEERRAAAAAPAPAAAPPVAAEPEGIPEKHVAAIAAAIYAVIGEHRILQIVDLHRHEGWVAEGRLAHHHSHAVEHHRRR